jgi:hypothetical protein
MVIRLNGIKMRAMMTSIESYCVVCALRVREGSRRPFDAEQHSDRQRYSAIASSFNGDRTAPLARVTSQTRKTPIRTSASARLKCLHPWHRHDLDDFYPCARHLEMGMVIAKYLCGRIMRFGLHN